MANIYAPRAHVCATEPHPAPVTVPALFAVAPQKGASCRHAHVCFWVTSPDEGFTTLGAGPLPLLVALFTKCMCVAGGGGGPAFCCPAVP